ncbi:unnamed protein product [Phytophthora fragariaefolia]|uniref:Unnamed protein product n=1 Tax=Phytophthora fragariaefolia TaxID=1490495 RepID=A0A9W6X4K5_9STRA|nr:unnamed protein product [Phytophthora fragariaefolia]
MFSSHDFDLASEIEHRQMSENEEDDSDNEVSSDDEEQGFFGSGMFGSSVDSRQHSGYAFGLSGDQASNFTDVHRFHKAHARRPSYPNGVGAKKPNKYRIISRYPEDRRRGLTAMLESCIEKKVIPLPWEKLIEEESAKRRGRGKKDISRANVIATMTAKEAARILVEINASDETIKYGFQSFGEGFIEDSSLCQANEADAKISETLQRRRSSIRSMKNISTPSTMTKSTDGTVPSERNSSTDTNSETASAASSINSGPHCDKTLANILLIVESMAGSLVRLLQDVSDLRKRDSRCRRCECCEPHYNLATQRALNSSPGVNVDSVVNITKFHDQTARKPSLVASQAPLNKRLNKRLSHRSSDSKIPHGFLRKIKSKIQENNPNQTSPKRENTVARPTQTPM